MKSLHATQETFFKIVDLSLVGIFVNNLVKSQLSTKYAVFYFFFKQRLYKIQKRPTSLFYHVLLIKQNECTFVINLRKKALQTRTDL